MAHEDNDGDESTFRRKLMAACYDSFFGWFSVCELLKSSTKIGCLKNRL